MQPEHPPDREQNKNTACSVLAKYTLWERKPGAGGTLLQCLQLKMAAAANKVKSHLQSGHPLVLHCFYSRLTFAPLLNDHTPGLDCLSYGQVLPLLLSMDHNTLLSCGRTSMNFQLFPFPWKELRKSSLQNLLFRKSNAYYYECLFVHWGLYQHFYMFDISYNLAPFYSPWSLTKYSLFRPWSKLSSILDSWKCCLCLSSYLISWIY